MPSRARLVSLALAAVVIGVAACGTTDGVPTGPELPPGPSYMTEEGLAMMEGCTENTPPHVCLNISMAIDSLTRHSNPACEAMGWEAKMRFEEASWSRLTYDDDNHFQYLHGAWESGTDVIYFTDLGGQSFQHALYTIAHEVSHAMWNRPENPRDFDSNNELIVQEGSAHWYGTECSDFDPYAI